jgi:hypothetical protein
LEDRVHTPLVRARSEKFTTTEKVYPDFQTKLDPQDDSKPVFYKGKNHGEAPLILVSETN